MLPRSPLPRVCIALGLPTADELLARARHEIAERESFLEFRLDHLRDPAEGLACIRQLVAERRDVMILATCRLASNHGHFRGDIEKQLRILRGAVEAGAIAVDVEIESAELAQNEMAEFRKETCLVVSYHNFDGTPAMSTVMRRLSKVEADVWKLVATARKPSDILRVLTAAKGKKTRVVLLSMGDMGVPSRILAPAFGSAWTYAAPNGIAGTAPGQLQARQLRSLYKADKLSRSAKVYGVIADPVRHSMSPAIHNRALQSKRIDAVYLPFLVPPPHLRDFVELGAKLPVSGFSVTIPHKQKIVKYLDFVEPLARRIGAVNTVWRKAGRWRGTNTDVAGVLEPLGKRIKVAKSSVLVVGTGGAARGAAFALADAGAEVSITGRSFDKVKALAKATAAAAVPQESVTAHRFDALVHATPLGMYPETSGCFFEDEIPADLVFDMVYNPLETELIRRAKAQHLDVISGIEMFVTQAAHQFELWTGETAPRPLMQKAVLEALSQPH